MLYFLFFQNKRMVVYCEEAVKDDKSVTGNSKFDELQDKLMYFRVRKRIIHD